MAHSKAFLFFLLAALRAWGAHAADTADDFLGYWKTPQGDGIVQLQRCALYRNAPPTGLCGVIVWDAEVNNPHRVLALDCNRKVFEAAKFEDGVWKEGWAFDSRNKKFYNAKLRLKGELLSVRTYIGSEITGQTEMFTRVKEVPSGCEAKLPDSTFVKGVGG